MMTVSTKLYIHICRLSTKALIASAGLAILLHTAITAVFHIRHFPQLSESLGHLQDGLPLHVISAYPRVPTIPNVLMFGAKGAGTDVVANWLVSSGACTSKISHNEAEREGSTEPHFFDNPDLYQLGSKFYSSLYKHCDPTNSTQIILDATPETIDNPKRVFDVYDYAAGGLHKSLKLIVVLREPISREYYLYIKNETQELSFDEYAEKTLRTRILEARTKAISQSDTPADQLASWIKYFKRNQLLLLSYDELEYNRLRFMERVEQFLGKKLNRNLILDEEGSALARKIPQKAFQMLDPLYYGKNQELYHWLAMNPGPESEETPFHEYESVRDGSDIFPNVLLVGSRFAGIPLIADLLLHNNACGAALFNNEELSMVKQPEFFDQDTKYKQGAEFYAKRFKHCQMEGNTELIVDGTPHYFTYSDRVYNLYQQAPDEALARLKIIMVLREPMAREKHMFQLKVKKLNMAKKKTVWFLDINNSMLGWLMDIVDENGEVKSFEQYAETNLIHKLNDFDHNNFACEGRYVDHLRSWFKYFLRRQFLILNYDELRNDPATVQGRIEKFLGRNFTGSLGKVSDDGSISPRVKAALGPLFDRKNEELYAFLKSHEGPSEVISFPPFVVNG